MQSWQISSINTYNIHWFGQTNQTFFGKADFNDMLQNLLLFLVVLKNVFGPWPYSEIVEST